MKTKITLLPALLSLLLSLNSRAEDVPIMERRNWIEKAFEHIGDAQCDDKYKIWRCLFPAKNDCLKNLKDAYGPCAKYSIPDLPEYINSSETKEQADKVIVSCMTIELSKKYILSLTKEKLTEYNECTGTAPRSKPLNPNMEKAMDFSKTQTGASCAEGSYLRKCFPLTDISCKDLVSKAQLSCTLKLESEGIVVKKEDSSIEEAGRKITDCALFDVKKAVAGSKKKSSDPDCN